MRVKPPLVALAATSALLSGCQTVGEAPVASFDQTLDRHISAIQSRDMKGMIDTITTGDRLELIFPDGSRQATRQEFLDFHEKWFADRSWVMVVEPVSSWQGRDYGYALYRTSYDPDGSGPKAGRPAWLSLGFALENGHWRLVHDQNTRIDAAPQ